MEFCVQRCTARSHARTHNRRSHTHQIRDFTQIVHREANFDPCDIQSDLGTASFWRQHVLNMLEYSVEKEE